MKSSVKWGWQPEHWGGKEAATCRIIASSGELPCEVWFPTAEEGETCRHDCLLTHSFQIWQISPDRSHSFTSFAYLDNQNPVAIPKYKMSWGFRVQEGWPLSVPALVRGRNLQISSQEEGGYHTDSLGTDSSNQRQSFPFLKLLPQARSWLRHPPLQPSELDLPAQAERLVPTSVSKTQHFSCRKKFVPAATSSLLRSVAPGTCCCRNPRLKGSAAPEAGDSRDLRLQVSRPFEGMRYPRLLLLWRLIRKDMLRTPETPLQL